MRTKTMYLKPLLVPLLLAVVVLAGLVGPQATTTRSAGPLALPPGFIDETVLSGMRSPRAFVWMPDGRMLIAERGKATSPDINFASVRIAYPDPNPNNAGKYLLGARAVSFDICGDGERGFLGIALDPEFDLNGGYVYTYYTRQTGTTPACGASWMQEGGQPLPESKWSRNRVSRWTMVGDTINPNSEKVLVDNILSATGVHNAGDLYFGPDGNLYITSGDGLIEPSPARDNTSLNGKLLRIRPDDSNPTGYTIPDDNPYKNTAGSRLCGPLGATGSGVCREIYASGFRNPFRMAVRPGSGDIFAFDVGGGAWEEVNLVTKGGDHGWPAREGKCDPGVICTPGSPPAGFADPIYAYQHLTNNGSDDAAVIGGAFYTGSSYPATYQNNLFFADYTRGFMQRLVENSPGNWSKQDFATGGKSIIGIRVGPDTNLYYVEVDDDNDSRIHRIRYQAGANQPPTARIATTPNPPSGALPLTVTFSGAGSTDPEGTTLTCNWDFGGGDTASQLCSQAIQRTFSTAGPRTVSLVAIDSGQASSDPATINVFPGNSPPSGTIILKNNTATNRDKYYAGDVWAYSADVDDAETPDDLTLTWKIDFHHRAHFHPFIGDTIRTSGEFQIPSIGEADYVVWYRVYLKITDGAGQTTTVQKDVYPVTAAVNLATTPAGAKVQLDGDTLTTPGSIPRVIGIHSSLTIASPQTFGGITYVFGGWSNNQPQSQTVVIPPGGATFSATLKPLDRRSYLPGVRR